MRRLAVGDIVILSALNVKREDYFLFIAIRLLMCVQFVKEYLRELIKMEWKYFENKVGKETADKVARSIYLEGIGCTFNKNGVLDIPERDIRRAWKDTMHIAPPGWLGK